MIMIRLDCALYWIIIAVLFEGLVGLWFYKKHLDKIRHELDTMRVELQNSTIVQIPQKGETP